MAVDRSGPRAHAIVNPFGGNKVGPRLLEDARSVFEDAGFRVLAYETEYAGHARDYARSLLLEPDDLLVPIGGDGTLFEVVGGLLARDDEQRVRVAPIPGGASNYMGQALGIPVEDGEGAARAIVSGEPRAVDLGRVQSGDRTVHGVCALSWGFVQEFAACADRHRWMGVRRYTAAGLQALWKTGPREGRLTLDGEQAIDGAFSLFLCLNSESMGRDRALLPGAQIDDGHWDVVFCRALSKADLADVVTRMDRGDGSWLDSEHVEHRRVRRFELDGDERDPVNVDGETNLSMPLRFEVEPGAVTMMGKGRSGALS